MTRNVVGGLLLLLFPLTLVLTAQDWDWQLPRGVPRPAVPADNPMTTAKVELGRHLFYDKRMSVNGTGGCASCHMQEIAFADGHARPESVVGDIHPRGSLSLVNVAYAPSLDWAHSGAASLEEQALTPLLAIDPIIELGLLDHEQEFFDMLRGDATYQRLFPQAFPGEAVSIKNVTKALAAFERSIVSMRSPYDRYKFGGEAAAISASAKRGEALFTSTGCAQCHGGFNFGAVRVEGEPENVGSAIFFNTGLTYEAPNRGLYENTGRFDDFGRFRAPTLRNIAITDPYMHDGSMATLYEVIDHYASGGGFNQANRTPMLKPFSVTDAEKDDLVEFLKTLTDQELLRDARWSNPWPVGPARY